MSKISRRALLFGRSRDAHTAQRGTAPAEPPLPRVIAWLEECADEPPLPTAQPTLPILRPPGAIEEERFLRACTRCGDCAQACPHDAIAPAPAHFRSAAQTPRIDPGKAPCWLCADTPCVSACGAGALDLDSPPMGRAEIASWDCLNTLGTTCTSCVEQCPVEHALSVEKGVPRVNRGACVGCGVCHYVCPAPQNAVRILPRSPGAYG